MAEAPNPGIGGYEGVWILPIQLDEDGKIAGVHTGPPALSPFTANHVKDLTPTFAVNPDDTAESEEITVDSISNITWKIGLSGEIRNLKTGDLEAGGSGATGGRPSKISGTIYNAGKAKVQALEALRGALVAVIAPWARTYTAGVEDGVAFVGIIGKISADIAPNIAGKAVVEVPFEVTGGKAYESVTATGNTETLAVFNSAADITQVGDAGVLAAPTVTDGAGIAQILKGDVAFLD